MIADAAFNVRLADLRVQMDAAKTASSLLADIDGALFARVAGRIGELANDCEQKLGAAKAKLVEDERAAWDTLRTAQEAVGSLSKESLAFAQGAVARREVLDGGICGLADKLLDYLNELGRLNWRGFTIVAETAFYGDVGDVIRLRFPELGIWHLPVASHEFGHYANPSIRVEIRDGSYRGWQYPVQALLDSKWDRYNQKRWFHAHEYFADIYAVYVLGPAYGYCSMLLRPDPGTLRSETTDHPSWNERYFLIVATLRNITSHGGASSQVVDDIERRWAANRSASPGTKEPNTVELQALLHEFYPLLEENLRGSRYCSFVKAQQLLPFLSTGEGQDSALDGVSIPDVLNAAWLARVNRLDDLAYARVIERRAEDACNSL